MAKIKLQGFDLERSRQATKTRKNIGAALDTIFNELNCYSNQDNLADILISNITGQHRTLQQDFWRVMTGVITGYGELAYADGRNEGAVNMCKQITAALEQYDGALPRI